MLPQELGEREVEAEAGVSLLPQSLQTNPTPFFLASSVSYSQVSVIDVTFAGFAMSPMVLFDKAGPVCDAHDIFLGCPIPNRHLNLSREIKIPRLDDISSLPKRLHNAKVVLSDDKSLVPCVHLFLDMSPTADQLASPVPGVMVLEPVDPNTTKQQQQMKRLHQHEHHQSRVLVR